MPGRGSHAKPLKGLLKWLRRTLEGKRRKEKTWALFTRGFEEWRRWC